MFQGALPDAECLNALRLLRTNWLKSRVMEACLPNGLGLIAMQINAGGDTFLSPFSLCCLRDVLDAVLHSRLCVGAVRVT